MMRRTVLLGLVLAGIAGTAGCGGHTDQPSPSPSSSVAADDSSAPPSTAPSSSTTPSPYPVSSLSAAPVGETAHLAFSDADIHADGQPAVPAVLHIVSLRATGTTAVLTFWITAPKADLLPPLNAFDPSAWPTLRVGRTTYTVDTYARSAGQNRCVCSDPPRLDGSTPKPMDATFTLADTGATEVQVGIQGASTTVAVPVTR